MYLNILKKDLRRNKSMNVILIIFIIMAVALITSSSSSFISITSSIESSFDKAKISDFMLVTVKEDIIEKEMDRFLKDNEVITDYTRDEIMFATSDHFLTESGITMKIDNMITLSSLPLNTQNIFDAHNELLTNIGNDEIYMPNKILKTANIEVGDKFTIKIGDYEKILTVKDPMKDIFVGEPMIGINRMFISEATYQEILNLNVLNTGYVTFIDVSDLEQFKDILVKSDVTILFLMDRDQLPMVYMMDTIIIGVFLIVSICLILISLLILRFTILFTLSEEFREIGIMKAIGITEKKIRGLYLLKYLAISVIGAAMGFFIGVPLTDAFLSNFSRSLILTGNENAIVVQILSAVAVVLIVMMFCYFCTKRISKFTPIDAIRNGSIGERYRKKGFIRLSTAKISSVLFMAINDITSNFKRFAVLFVTFVISILLIIIPINTINTLDSDEIASLFGLQKSDLVLRELVKSQELLSMNKIELEQYVDDFEQKLLENGIKADTSMECIFSANIIFKEKSLTINTAQQGIRSQADEIDFYIEGIAPKLENEIAISHLVAKELGAAIGDSITVKINKVNQSYLITAISESMNNLGEAVIFSENAELPYGETILIAAMPVQVKYTDHPTKQQKADRLELMKDLFPNSEAISVNEYIDDMIGGISGQIKEVRTLILVIVCAVNILVVVLLSRSFITKETGEIAMLKGIGFCNGAIMRWQIIRLGLIMFAATLIAVLISTPLSEASTGKVFEMMGCIKIDFTIKPLEVFVIYPAIMFAVNIIAGAFSTLTIRKVSVQETNNIE